MVAVFVVATFVVFILVDGALQWSRARKEKELRSAVAQANGIGLALSPAMIQAPAGLFVDAGHTWLSLDESGRSRIGIDAFARRVIGQMDRVDLPQTGKSVTRGEPLFAVTQGTRSAEFLAPVDGTVVAVNEAVGREPGLVKADPYHRGWICVLNPSNLAEDIKELMVGAESEGWFAKEIERFREFFTVRSVQHLALGSVMQDGGEVTEGVLELLDDDSWRQFSHDFLCQPAQAHTTE
jgi:glycine cleavage system H protein